MRRKGLCPTIFQSAFGGIRSRKIESETFNKTVSYLPRRMTWRPALSGAEGRSGIIDMKKRLDKDGPLYYYNQFHCQLDTQILTNCNTGTQETQEYCKSQLPSDNPPKITVKVVNQIKIVSLKKIIYLRRDNPQQGI